MDLSWRSRAFESLCPPTAEHYLLSDAIVQSYSFIIFFTLCSHTVSIFTVIIFLTGRDGPCNFFPTSPPKMEAMLDFDVLSDAFGPFAHQDEQYVSSLA